MILQAQGGLIGAFSTTLFAAVTLLIYAAVLASPLLLVRRTEPSAYARLSIALLLIVSLLAVATTVQGSLLLKLQRMQHAIVLSFHTAAKAVEDGAGSAAPGGPCECGHLGVPPGHTDAEATAMWRGAPMLRRMAVLGLLACAHLGLAAPIFQTGVAAFPAIVLATSAVPLLVVAGGFFVLRARDLELTWKLLKQVRARPFPREGTNTREFRASYSNAMHVSKPRQNVVPGSV